MLKGIEERFSGQILYDNWMQSIQKEYEIRLEQRIHAYLFASDI